MSILQKHYNRSFGDYGTFQSLVRYGIQHKEFRDSGFYTKEDWDDKHRCWTYEPLMGDKV